MKSMVVADDGWRSGPLEVASTFRRRWRGLRPRADGRSLLLQTRSVHTIGMAEPIHVVFLAPTFEVLDVRTVEPGRVCVERGATWVLELDHRRHPPRVGARMRLVAR